MRNTGTGLFNSDVALCRSSLICASDFTRWFLFCTELLSATSLVEDQLGRKRMASKALKIAFSTVALSVGGALGTPDVFAQDANNLVGTWTLVSSITEKGLEPTNLDQGPRGC